MKVLFHKSAIDDLILVYSYCRSNFGLSVAKKLRSRIDKSISLLKTRPYIGQVEPLLLGCTSLEYRKMVILPYLKIIYSIHKEYIYIHVVWDVRQDENKLTNSVVNRYKNFDGSSVYNANEPETEYSKAKEV